MRKIIISFIFLWTQVVPATAAEKKFVFIIPSYNNAEWCAWNLQSIVDQTYDNYRIIYINDASTDGTPELVQKIVDATKLKGRFKLICNEQNKYQLTNRYNAIHSCADDEIMVMLDGDDALANKYVLETLNKVYQNENVWFAQSLHKECCNWCMQDILYTARCKHAKKPKGCKGYSRKTIRQNAYRNERKGPFHLRTFYAWLFKKIKIEDLQLDGRFIQLATDTATFFPMIEMASRHAVCIPEALYLYNKSNTNSIHADKLRVKQRRKVVHYLVKAEKYKPLAETEARHVENT